MNTTHSLLRSAANIIRLFVADHALKEKEGNRFICLYCEGEFRRSPGLRANGKGRRTLMEGDHTAICPVRRGRQWLVRYDELGLTENG